MFEQLPKADRHAGSVAAGRACHTPTCYAMMFTPPSTYVVSPDRRRA
jgi:hypothetical protein